MLGEIKIKCSASEYLELDDLIQIQGNLKDLSKTNYEKLKGQILKHGFISPIHVWLNDGKNKCLDGHQRIRTLTAMREEGYVIPKLPVTMIECENEKLAREILLSLVSQYGELNDQGLYEYISESGIDFAELDNFVLDYEGVDLNKFNESFNLAVEEIKEPKPVTKHKCPNCGIEF